MFDRFFNKMMSGCVWMLFHAVLGGLAMLPGVLCLPSGWSAWGRSLLRSGAIHLEGRSWAFLFKHINRASLGVKCLATVQAVFVWGVACYATFLTPNNIAHLSGAIFIDLFAAIAAVGIVRDAWKMQGDIEGGGMMRAFWLIESE